MKRLIAGSMLVFLSMQLFAQQGISVATVIAKTDTVYQFNLTGKSLDEELSGLTATIGNPASESCGEMVWNSVDIPGVSNDLRLKITDGLLTIKGDKSRFEPFTNTRNKNKSKTCLLMCLEENQYRRFIFTIMDDEANVINNVALKEAVVEYLKSIIRM
jgi:hypothetical protein